MALSLGVTLIISSLFIRVCEVSSHAESLEGGRAALFGDACGGVGYGHSICNKPKVPKGLKVYNIPTHKSATYFFFLCLSFLRRFLRLWVDILCLFLFLPLGIIVRFNKDG